MNPVLIAIILQVAAPPVSAPDFAEIDSPVLVFKAEFPESLQTKIAEAINSNDLRFVKGYSLNFFTTLIYQGETIPLNKLLEKLSKCPGFTIHVSFKNGSESFHYLYGNDFSIHQMGGESKIQVIINTASERVDLERLYLPDIYGRE